MSETLANSVRSNDRSNDTASPMASLQVEVIADFVCPFCFLGKRRFDEALKAVQGPRDVSWHPYQMNPDLPPDGLAFDAYLTQKFGSPASVEPVLQHLVREGDRVGIKFRFDRIQTMPNTLHIHQVMQLAETLGIDPSALAEDFMSAFFELGIDIGERSALIGIAGKHGISPAAVGKAIDSDTIRKVVLTREQQLRTSGFENVPGFLMNRRLLVVGAQDVDSIVNAFDLAMFGEGTDALVPRELH